MRLPKLRTIVCSAIVLAFAVTTLVIFGVAHEVRGEYSSVKIDYTGIDTQVKGIENQYINDKDQYLQPGGAAYDQYQALLPVLAEKKAAMDDVNTRYTTLAVTGYVLSIATLTAFGLALHYLDNAKEKEDMAIENQSIALEKKMKEEEEEARQAAKRAAK